MQDKLEQQIEQSIERQEGHKPGWNYKIVGFFLHNPQLTVMLLVMLVVLGVASFFSLRVEGFPTVNLPVAVVTTVVPGAGPETVQDTVSNPIESAIVDLDGVKEVSTTSQSNISSVVITYEDGVDVNIAVQEVRNKIETIDFPEGIQSPNIIVPDIGGAPFLIAISGGTDLLSLQKEAEYLEDKLLEIEGVKSFNNISGIEENIYIELAPQYQSPQIIDQIKAANVGFPLGETNIDGKRIPVVAKSSVDSLNDLRAIQVTLPDGQRVALSDIASVYTGVDYGNRVHRTGFLDSDENVFKIQPALIYELKLESDADLLKINEEVEDLIQNTEPENSRVDYAIVLNQADQAQRQVDEIVEGALGGKWNFDNPFSYVGLLFGGAWLLLIAMLLFLDWRTALISVVSLPLSFFFTFIVLAVLGVELNTIVLFSLVLVLGLVVDPAIVVLESIRRYVDLGYKGKEAVLRSVDVIGLGLFVAVLTSVIVFVPFSVVSGTFGQIIAYIPITVFPALIASYFVPLIFLTWLGEKFIKPNDSDHLRDEDDVHTLWPLAQWFIKANRYILSRKWLQVVVVVLGLVIPITIAAALFATDQVRQVQFAQPDDVDYIEATIPRPANQTYRDLQIMATEIEGVLKNYAGETKAFVYLSSGGGNSQNNLSIFIELVQPEDRDLKSGEVAERIQNDLREKFGANVRVGELGAGPPAGDFPVSVKIFESDTQKLAVASNRIADELRSYPEVDVVVTDFDAQSKELTIKVDPEKAAANGLSAPAVYGQVANLLGEDTIFRIEDTDVVVRIPDDTKPVTTEALLASVVFGNNGPVALRDIAVVEEAEVPGSIRSLNGERFASVNATVTDSRDAINIQRKIGDWAKERTGELGVNDRAFENRAGVNEFEQSFQELFMAIFFAILVTYVAFVIFFRSFVQPFIILFAIPLILIGVFPALAIFAGGQFGFLEVIGILMVIGIAENVGIFLIDYANRKVRLGMNKKEAVAIASGIRLRPIVLTKLTALAGLLPLAVFSPFWRGLALVVIFGILSSGALSLFTTPVLYNWFTRTKNLRTDVSDDGQEPLPLPGNTIGSNQPTELPPSLEI